MDMVQFHASPFVLKVAGPSEPTRKAQTKEPKGCVPHSPPRTRCRHRLSARSISEANVDRRRRREEERERERGEASKMSGNGVVKKVAGAAAKAGKAIDWDGLAKMLVSEEARKEFATLRRTFEDVNHQLQTKFSQEPQPIDWEYYRKGIGSKVVDMYKEAYESIEIPKYVDTVTPQYKPKFDALLVEMKEAEKASLKESERIEKEIAEMKEMKKKISTMTADEYFAKHPELKQKFDDEIRNDYWGY
ncbi:hypothetical protein GQ55_2G111900 [Panicum hallii var. hallii]|uniref:Uncharacterized protein n=1 Tax=Panicum hallii var. hallii TaxID=1504633 RepID=A0A2T7ENS4_9POAL|nr:hypothetical protein GQ55_2G111900 [Panicum hallii var. hallii]